ncbi:hypothetical protein ZWY2020_056291 [Hordeum vulgare]|nr:hypothetical protein ZWY2020_056291 [Hordeum vulgare]
MGLLSRSEEVAVLVRLKVAAGPIRREIPPEMHWDFAYEMLQRVSCSLALGPELRNAIFGDLAASLVVSFSLVISLDDGELLLLESWW